MLRSARNGWQLPRKEAETTRRARERTSPASVSTQWELFHAGVLFLRSWCISNHFSCRKPPYQNTVTSNSSFSNIWHCKAWNSSFCCLTLPGIDRQGILRCLPLLAETKDLLWWISHGPGRCSCWWSSCLFSKSPFTPISGYGMLQGKTFLSLLYPMLAADCHTNTFFLQVKIVP